MKTFVILLTFFLSVNLYAQSNPMHDPRLCARIRKTVNLIIIKDAKTLSKQIVYPIQRNYPLLSIKNSKDFILKFDELFDSVFVRKLTLYYTDSVIMERNGNYGLVKGEPETGFTGELWFNYDGKILAINNTSEKGELERIRLEDSIRLNTHPSVRNWSSNELIASSKKYLIRIDRVGDTLRYVSWNKGKTQSDKPDLIILGGEWVSNGSVGGWTWTFQNKGWEYIVDQSYSYMGTLFLYINKDGGEKYTTRLTPLER